MADNEINGLDGLTADANNLYREEIFTDMKSASIRRITPVKADGSEDSSRETVYNAHTQIMTQSGALPISTQVEANSLGEAFEKFPEAIKAEVQRIRDEVQKQQLANAGKGLNMEGLKGQQGQGGGAGNIIT